MRAIVCFAIAFGLLVVLPTAATAQPSPEAERAFREGEASFRLGHYSEAITAFETAYRLSNAPKLLYNIAQAYRRRFDIQGDPTDLRRARDLYQSYLQLDPATNKRAEVAGILAEIETRLADPTVASGLPVLDHRPPGPIVAGSALELPVTVSRDPSHRVTKIVARYRRGATGALHEATAVAGQAVRLSANSLPTAGAPYQIQYFLEGRASDGTALTNLGSATEPLVIDVQAPPPEQVARPGQRQHASGGSILGTWWFWTLTGVVVVGAATTAVVLTTDTTPDSDLGAIDLR